MQEMDSARRVCTEKAEDEPGGRVSVGGSGGRGKWRAAGVGTGVCVDGGQPASWGGRVCLIPPGLAARRVG